MSALGEHAELGPLLRRIVLNHDLVTNLVAEEISATLHISKPDASALMFLGFLVVASFACAPAAEDKNVWRLLCASSSLIWLGVFNATATINYGFSLFDPLLFVGFPFALARMTRSGNYGPDRVLFKLGPAAIHD